MCSTLPKSPFVVRRSQGTERLGWALEYFQRGRSPPSLVLVHGGPLQSESTRLVHPDTLAERKGAVSLFTSNSRYSGATDYLGEVKTEEYIIFFLLETLNRKDKKECNNLSPKHHILIFYHVYLLQIPLFFKKKILQTSSKLPGSTPAFAPIPFLPLL